MELIYATHLGDNPEKYFDYHIKVPFYKFTCDIVSY